MPERRVLASFFLSGMAALVCQVVWVRLFLPVFGNTIFSASAVVAAFLGGLAGGSALCALVIARRPARDWLRVYALVEAGIALSALLLPWAVEGCGSLLGLLHRLPAGPGALAAARALLALLVLAIPCGLMGGTFPVLVEAARARGPATPETAGRLYAANTLGSAAGAALVGFVLLPAVGNWRTCLIAAGLNLAAAALVVLGRPSGAGQRAPEDASAATPAAVPAAARAAALVLLFGSGTAALVYEIAWTRVLSLVFGPVTYMFSAILASVILGSGLGALVAARWTRSAAAPLGALCAVELAIAAAALGVNGAVSRLPFVALRLGRELASAPARLFATEGLVVLGLLLVPTFLMGLVFPLGLCAYGGASRPGRTAGALFAASTLGSILGAVAAGFVLIPNLGSHRTLLAAAGLNVALAAGLWLLREPGGWKPAALAAALVVAVAPWGIRPWPVAELTAGGYKYAPYWPAELDPELFLERGRSVYFRDGLYGAVAVRDIAGRRLLSIQGKVDASDGSDMAAQLLVGHLPLAHVAEPRRVAIVGVGSGVTVHAVLAHPVGQVDVVEISPEVVEASRAFEHVNGRALEDARVRLTVGDGRNFLRYQSARYDVIVSEPSNPWISGMATLFTREYFTLARERLAPGGFFCQWLQSYNLDERDLRSLLGTFAEVFPHCWLWAASDLDLVLLGATSPALPAASAVEAALGRPESARQLASVGFADPHLVWFLYLMDRRAMKAVAGDAPIHTDDLPFLEYSAARMLHADTSAGNFGLLVRGRTPPPHPGWRPPDAGEIPGLTMAIGAFYERAENPMQAFQAYRRAFVLGADPREAGRALLRTGGDRATRAALDQTLRMVAPGSRVARGLLARLDLGSAPARALEAVEPLLAADPADPDALSVRSEALLRLGRGAEALETARRLAAGAPERGESWRVLASALLATRAPAEAAAAAREALARTPGDAQALTLLASAHAELGEPARAEQLLREAIAAEPRNARLHLNLARFLLAGNRFAESEAPFRVAVELEPANPQCLVALGDWFAAGRAGSVAARWYRQALRVAPGDPAARARLDALEGNRTAAPAKP